MKHGATYDGRGACVTARIFAPKSRLTPLPRDWREATCKGRCGKGIVGFGRPRDTGLLAKSSMGNSSLLNAAIRRDAQVGRPSTRTGRQKRGVVMERMSTVPTHGSLLDEGAQPIDGGIPLLGNRLEMPLGLVEAFRF